MSLPKKSMVYGASSCFKYFVCRASTFHLIFQFCSGSTRPTLLFLLSLSLSPSPSLPSGSEEPGRRPQNWKLERHPYSNLLHKLSPVTWPLRASLLSKVRRPNPSPFYHENLTIQYSIFFLEYTM